ncbi:hypothetical protein V6N12_036609 [Hibiscus sabdariffa]|uniref:Uncharacterized protein n=1 Tax=Hibiscus sabdariffa TaxID=183260 RepID=A0ABR2ERK4_9ROSI
MLVTRLILPWHICGSNKIVMDDKGDASAGRQRVLPGPIILAGTSEFGRASCCVTGLSLSPVTVCLACTQYPSAEKLSPFYYRCRKNIFLTRKTVVASS